jgi:hypothetical protein
MNLHSYEYFKSQSQAEKLKKVKLLTPLKIKTYVASIQKSNPSELGKLMHQILYKLHSSFFSRLNLLRL